MARDDLIVLARSTAAAHGLDPVVVCAVAEQESDWNPWAVRFEPAFYKKYTQPMHLTDTEEYTRAISFGLMQIMGEVARELGLTAPFLSILCDPAAGLEYGCRHLANKLRNAGGDVAAALLHYNGGGNPNYPAEVLARKVHYL